MDTFKIECFLTLAELNNFTKTGEKLHISQPAVSKNIFSLEQELGLTLIDRSKRRPALTAAGELLAEWFRSAEAEFRLRLSEARLLVEGSGHSLNIGLLTGTGCHELSEALLYFHREHPSLPYSIDTHSANTILSGLKQGDFDLTITIDFGFSDDTDIEVTPLFRGSFILMYSSTLSLSAEPDLTAFRNTTFLLPKGDDKEFMENVLRGLCAEYGFTPKMEARTSSLESAFNMVEGNLGAILISSFSLNDSLRNRGTLHWIDTGAPCSYVAARLKSNNDPLVLSFLELLRSLCGGSETV